MRIEHPVAELLLEVADGPEFRAILREIERSAVERRGADLYACGLTVPAKTLLAVLLRRALRKPLVYVTRSNREAEQALDLLGTWAKLLGESPPVFVPAHDIRPYQGLSPHADISEKRALGLWKIAARQAPLTVLPAAALASRMEPREFYEGLARLIRRGDEIDLDDLLRHLELAGYAPHDPVEMTGQYSLRGGILDLFSPETRRPVRLELFGDEVYSIREFAVNTQRSVGPVEKAAILPLTEFPLRKELLEEFSSHPEVSQSPVFIPGEPFPGWEFLVPLLNPLPGTILDLIDDAVVFLDEPQELRKQIEHLWLLLEAEFAEAQSEGRVAAAPEQLFLRWEVLAGGWARLPVLNAEELDMAAPPEAASPRFSFSTRPAPRFHGNVPLCLSELENLLRQQYRVLFLTASQGESERLAELFAEYKIPFHLAERPKQSDAFWEEKSQLSSALPTCWISKGVAPNGVMIPPRRLLILGNQDLYDASEAVARPAAPRSKVSTFLSDFRDLQAGDYVVHVEHGIGCYRRLREIEHDGITSEFMELEYQSEARLYVPLARLDLVQKYRGLEGGRPTLDKLGGGSWARTKARIRKSMQEMADELLKLYAERKTADGHAFTGDSHWEREFEETFEYEETEGQLGALQDVRRDMEKAEPMDRLLCGDVGYGKTEVAMRAAFRAASQNKQVALLAPTTVLAFQHHETFRQRMAAFPLRVEMLSRFRSTAQQKAVLQDLAVGKVDVVVGTHRLLSKDVAFQDLGLVIVDEEQRFGVRHKERLKAMKKSVDVLSLSATPIPRTLHMSLAGLRDMSLIETPPKDRLAIQTVVAPFREQLVRTAIEQELERGGQVYFVHNRVESLHSIAALIQKLVPHARIAVAHGQMGERQLEKVMLGFIRQQSDVLVTTTIIENGLDIPQVNTILVNRADRHGLAELYQLRGRVGRSNRRAYAYLLVPNKEELTPLARRRLSALKEFSELGSGFRVAALDMELRGAGNLLGREQHGQVNAIGFEMYCRMLEGAVQQLRGETTRPEVATTINLGLDIRIPPAYIAEESQRLRMYKTIGAIESAEQRAAVEQELEDRYGALPAAVLNLLEYASLKALAQRFLIQSIERKSEMLNIQFHSSAPVDPERLTKFISKHQDVQFTPAGMLRIPFRGNSHDLLPQVQKVLAAIEGLSR